MAVNKNIILGFLLIFSSSSFAISDEDKEIIKLSHQKMTEAYNAVNERLEYCNQFPEKIVSDEIAQTIKDINFTESELRTALFYSYILAKKKCETDEVFDKLSARIAETKALEEYFKNEFIVLDSVDMTGICCIRPLSFLRTEIKYLKIDQKKRSKLEKIDELKEQFDVTKTVKKILNY